MNQPDIKLTIVNISYCPIGDMDGNYSIGHSTTRTTQRKTFDANLLIIKLI